MWRASLVALRSPNVRWKQKLTRLSFLSLHPDHNANISVYLYSPMGADILAGSVSLIEENRRQ